MRPASVSWWSSWWSSRIDHGVIGRDAADQSGESHRLALPEHESHE